ncbi:acyl-CoA thioesterase [Christensenellaceae bacterium OttesenSCG-928-K19]|nr:acyl-CoA thioesterase [Christensenellaceae bacterium OttesenSCG-928-K19]
MELKPYIRKTNYYETDQMGIIHHSNYIRYFEEARVDFMEQLGFGYARTEQEGVEIAVLEVQCRYKTMVRFGDTICIRLSIKELTPAKMVVGYSIEDAKTGELRTTGETLHCFLSGGADKKLVRLNRTLPKLYDLLAACVAEEK